MAGIREYLLDLFFPVRAQCLGCGDERGCDEPFLCNTCLKLMWPVNAVVQHDDWIRRGLDMACFAHRYARPVKGLIHAFKYRSVSMLASLMAEDMHKLMISRGIGPYDAIIPVPLHPARQRKRGYNQAGMLAEELSLRSGIPVKANVLRRVRNTRQQAKLTKDRRSINILGAFTTDKDLTGMRILLLDDVITTGSTACACAEVLKKSGAEYVDAIAFAGACRYSLNSGRVYRLKRQKMSPLNSRTR